MRWIFGLMCVLAVLGTSLQSQPQLVPTGQHLVGDILVETDADLEAALGATVNGLRIWPGGRVPLDFGAEISAARRALALAVCNRWGATANIQCVPRAGETAYAFVTSQWPTQRGCYATLGTTGGQSVVNLDDPGCWNEATILHEFGHTVGLNHEHQRPDRDAFVTVDFANIQPTSSALGSYSIVPLLTRGPYDLRSIMHYTRGAFAITPTRPVMQPIGGYEDLLNSMGLGRRVGTATLPTAGDALAVQLIYGPNGGVPAAPQNLQISSAADGQVNVAWTPPASAAAPRAYRIEVAGDPAFVRPLVGATVPASLNAVSGALPAGIWNIRMTSIGDAGDGAQTEPVTFAWPGGARITPPPPPALTVSAAANPVRLSWTPGSGVGSAATAYTVYAGRQAYQSDLATVHVGGSTSLSGAAPLDTRLYVRVLAANAAGHSISNEVPFVVPSGVRPLPPLLMTAVASGNTATITWLPASTGPPATSFVVMARYSQSGPIIASVPATGTSLVVRNVPAGLYQLTVAGVNVGLQGAESNFGSLQVR